VHNMKKTLVTTSIVCGQIKLKTLCLSGSTLFRKSGFLLKKQR